MAVAKLLHTVNFSIFFCFFFATASARIEWLPNVPWRWKGKYGKCRDGVTTFLSRCYALISVRMEQQCFWQYWPPAMYLNEIRDNKASMLSSSNSHWTHVKELSEEAIKAVIDLRKQRGLCFIINRHANHHLTYMLEKQEKGNDFVHSRHPIRQNHCSRGANGRFASSTKTCRFLAFLRKGRKDLSSLSTGQLKGIRAGSN
jgi:hypothetical protein